MREIKNILFSTTRQWNPGDEFILQGIISILKRTNKFGIKDGTLRFNPIIYNRNPDIRTDARRKNSTQGKDFTKWFDNKNFKGKQYFLELFKIGHYENSFKDDMNPQSIDLIVFAGSPEWYNNKLKQLYKVIQVGNIPTAYIGIGLGESIDFQNLDSKVVRTLEKAKLITVRDFSTKEFLSKLGAIYLPCPAIFAANTEKIVTSCSHIGLIYATHNVLRNQNVSYEMYEYIKRLYIELAKRYRVSLVCHYIDEIEEAEKDFPNLNLFYSYDSRDYAEIYQQFDLVIGGRVHGIGMAASSGIPGIMINHDKRSDTVKRTTNRQFEKPWSIALIEYALFSANPRDI